MLLRTPTHIDHPILSYSSTRLPPNICTAPLRASLRSPGTAHGALSLGPSLAANLAQHLWTSTTELQGRDQRLQNAAKNLQQEPLAQASPISCLLTGFPTGKGRSRTPSPAPSSCSLALIILTDRAESGSMNERSNIR